MSASGCYGVPEVKAKIVENGSCSYDMDNVTSANLPAFNLKAGVGGEYSFH